MGDLSENFSRSEFACKCKCGFDAVDAELLKVAEIVRGVIGGYTPSSANRCWNDHVRIYKEIGKKPTNNSDHLKALAIDVPCDEPKDLYDFLDAAYPDKLALGLYRWGVHVGIRKGKARWKG